MKGMKGMKDPIGKTFMFFIVFMTFMCSALGCGSGAQPRFLSIATGGSGGVYFPYGGALARVLSAQVPGVQATAEVTGASVDNLKLMQLGKVDLAFTLADTLAEAVSGRGAFKETGPIGSVRTLAVLYTNYTHVVVKASLGIRRIADLKGKVISVGSPGSGTELIADRVLAAAGLDPRKDISRHALSVAESAGALKDGKLDAFFWSGGVPMQRDFGDRLYRLAMIPGGVYRALDQEVATIGVTNLLVASSAMDEALVYDIVRVMFEHKDALVAGHPEARHLAPPASMDVSPAPFHAGALRYYKDKGK
jgi:TRAP-type uncharacterized transport system substrate-binding protein